MKPTSSKKQSTAMQCKAKGCSRRTKSPSGFCFQHSDFANYSELPATIALNHKMLGVEPGMVCDACRRGDHWNCNLATWCSCDDDGDGNPDAGLNDFDPYGESLP